MKKLYIFLIVFFTINIVKAQYSILHSFGCAEGDGYYSYAVDVGFVLDSTFLYGIARYGGPYTDDGAIFKMKFDSTNITYLHDFLFDTAGPRPYGSLLLSNDTLYGVSTNGGLYGRGAIFSLTTDGSGFKRLFDFNLSMQESNPESPLVLYNNVLYGKTEGGGYIHGRCIYKINKDGTGYSKIKSFDPPLYSPYNNLIIKGDYLYGMEGDALFKMNLIDTSYTELINEPNLNPMGIIMTDSLIYCVTRTKIFSMNFDSSNYHTIFDFTLDSTGVNPYGNLCLVDSTFYGLATGGGKYGRGVIYKVNIDGTNYKTLFDFYDMIDVTGSCPSGYLVYKDSTLYGLTYMRRNMNCYGGNIFKFKLGEQTQTSNLTFNNITSSSVDISWKKGSGTKRVVFIRKGTNPVYLPTDFDYYSLDILNGNLDTLFNYCIYNDTGSYVTINNLQPNTIYTVHSFEYWYIKNGGIPVYNDIDTILNPTTFSTLLENINETPSDKNNLTIIPNPTKDNLTMETNNNTLQRLEITNLFWQTVFTSYINKKATINTSAFANGVYIIKLYTEKETVVRKFVKE